MILPLHLDLKGASVLVIGGGPRASRWIYLLLEAGAKLRVFAADLDFELKAFAKAKRFRWIRRDFRPADFEGSEMAVVATEDSKANSRALRLARSRKLWTISADPKLVGNAWQPPSFRRGGLLIHFGLPGKGRGGPLDEELRRYLKRRLSLAFGREWELLWEELSRLKRSLPLRKLLPAWIRSAKRGRVQSIRRDVEKMLRRPRS
jgi:siroheme synthase-like protein